MMRRFLVVLIVAGAVPACPGAGERAKEIGGAPAARLESARKDLDRAEAQAQEKLDAAAAAVEAQ